jgi:hypothetical protein
MILAYTFISWRTLRQMLKYCWNCFKFIYLYILKRDQLFWEDFLLTLKGLSIELFVLRVMVFNQQILHSWLVVINYEHSLTLQLYCACCGSFFLIVLGLFEWQWICIFLKCLVLQQNLAGSNSKGLSKCVRAIGSLSDRGPVVSER